MPERRQPPSRAIQVTADAAHDALARIRPGLFVRTFLTQLEQQGEAVLVRLFKMATSEDTPDAVALGAIDRILQLSNAKDIVAVALGLKQKRGRPGEDDTEARQQEDEWAKATDLHETPPGSGTFE